MSLEELREQNIRLVTEKALECFIKNGINNTRVSEIAAESGLTQRSRVQIFPLEGRYRHRRRVLLLGAHEGVYCARAAPPYGRRADRYRTDQHHPQQLCEHAVRRSRRDKIFAGRRSRAVQRRQERARYQQTAGALRDVQRPPVTGGAPRTCGRGRSILARTSSSCITTPTIPSSA